MDKITIDIKRRVLNELLDDRYSAIRELHTDSDLALENFEMKKYRKCEAIKTKVNFEIHVLETLIEEQS